MQIGKTGKNPAAVAFSSDDMQTCSKTGEHLPADVLVELGKGGFEVGMSVAPKSKLSEKYTIKTIGPVVTVERPNGETLEVAPQKFLQTFVKYDESWFPNTAERHAQSHEQFLRTYGRSVVSAAVQFAVLSHDSPKVSGVCQCFARFRC